MMKITDICLFPHYLAGGDKKADAGAGATTEFQFVSIFDQNTWQMREISSTDSFETTQNSIIHQNKFLIRLTHLWIKLFRSNHSYLHKVQISF